MTDKKISFLIDHIDPLGQGVYKSEDQIYFIPKTLPKESGQATVYKSKKNINFATLDSIKEKSDQRELSACPHYDSCNGCHFLHTNYESELQFKTNTLKRMAKYDFGDIDVTVHKAPRRFHYRNRIQLHYDTRQNLIGFINPKTKKIVNVSDCMMPTKELSQKFKEFLENWKKEVPNKATGHVELYLKDSELLKTWNKRYSESGFTQVFKEMNEVLNNLVQSKTSADHKTLDLFGGAGNLSNHINDRLIVDYYEEIDQDNKINLDLFEEKSITTMAPKVTSPIKCFIVDPPRKGFDLLSKWCEQFRPEHIIYVSCHSSTMFRDLAKIKESYKVEEIHLLDLFPSTFHFEGLTVLKRI